jgi:CubicO group peptidase (beta-lactamase class C family)
MKTATLLLPGALFFAITMGLASPAEPSYPEVSRAMDRFVGTEVAGVVTLVASKNRILHVDSAGFADTTSGRRMRPDTLCWIASMTKPVTAVAVMMLHEQGKLSLDDPVSKHIPELAGLKTADGRTVPITIKHLLTHTSGLAELTPQQAAQCRTLEETIPLVAAQPLKFEPGSKWVYCQSGINTAARIVEVVSGMPFPAYLERNLFRALGMKDTAFYLTEKQVERLSKTYRRTEDGRLEEAQNPILYGKSPVSRDRFPAANGGLYSTAQDYARFCQMILNKGKFGRRQYLKPESVELMTRVHTGDLKTGFTDGNGWGIGWCVIREPQGVTSMLSPGTFGHGGAHGTQAWIDLQRGLAFILMVQRVNFPNADASDVRRAFQEAAVNALGK